MKINLKYRGAPLSEAERKELNLKAGRLIDSLGFPMVHPWAIYITENDYDELRQKYNWVGYAHYYLGQCHDDSELMNEAETEIYRKLLEIDSKLGTTQTEQLFRCVFYSVRMDLIKVTE